MSGRGCTVAGCDGPHLARGYCRAHYMRWRRHGDPDATACPRHRVCVLPDCGGAHYGHGYCRTHYVRWRRGGDPAATVGLRGRVCVVPDCGRAHYGRGYCRTHHARWRRHGDPGAGRPVEHKTFGGVSHWSVRHRLTTERGPAAAQRCAECGAPARDWSYDGTDPHERADPVRGYRYSLDLDRYRPRCRSCHRRATTARTPPRPRCAPVVDVERAARLYTAGASARGVGALLGTSRTAVYTALRAHGVPIRAPGTRHPRPADRHRHRHRPHPTPMSTTPQHQPPTPLTTHHQHDTTAKHQEQRP